jgi:diacylglycerol kinase family enzyme
MSQDGSPESEASPAGGGEHPVPVLVNARAGQAGEGALRSVIAALEEAGVNARVRAVDPARLAEEVERAAREADVVAVCGGDGTQLTAAEVLAGEAVALAPLPTGTLNHFARRLGLEDVPAAVAALAGGRSSCLPVGVVDDRIFLNTATFGLYADVVRRRERLRRWMGKWPAAAVALAIRVIRMRRLEVILEVEGKRLYRKTPLVWVGLGWGSFPRVHEAPERRRSPDLEIVVLRPRGRFGVVRLLARFARDLLWRQRPVEDPALEVFHARWVLIRARRRIGVTLDGEVLRAQSPVFVAVQDDALRVVTP